MARPPSARSPLGLLGRATAPCGAVQHRLTSTCRRCVVGRPRSGADDYAVVGNAAPSRCSAQG
jgi:hypothetical protein